MERTVQFGTQEAAGTLAFQNTNPAFERYEQLHSRIKQLLQASNDAKDQGNWKRAQEILLEVRRLTKDSIEARA